MRQKNRSVLGIYRNRKDAEKAVDALQIGSFSSSEISILSQDDVEKGSTTFESVNPSLYNSGIFTYSKRGVIIGCFLGLLISFLVIFTSIHASHITEVIIEFAITGTVLGGIIGGIAGTFAAMILPVDQNERSEIVQSMKLSTIERINERVLIAVQATDSFRAADANRILKDTGATSISTIEEKQFSNIDHSL